MHVKCFDSTAILYLENNTITEAIINPGVDIEHLLNYLEYVGNSSGYNNILGGV